ncbi:CIA30 family protein [Accumulibacter sp.]|uniref:CIA30 family protein n=1 Tax=Accumulibacter sp. TaxID=2053492 RepID=UPI001A52AA5D|nr:CIA30 family protein [Accumulibacter sp.]MBL8373994.1 CIA30 family protein [Accumulibacter sp.]
MPEARWSSAASSRLLVALDTPTSVLAWSAVDDAVMGGLSSSHLLFDPSGHADFTGSVSLANNGGFASVRTAPGDYSAPGALSFRLAVRGDGRCYKLNLRTDDAFDGPNHQAVFSPPAGQWSEIVLAIADFIARHRGRPVDAPPLDPARIRRVGLMIADRQVGSFRLSIRWLRAEAPGSL